MTGRAPSTAEALRAALRDLGVECAVEARDALAILVDVRADGVALEADGRARIVAAARAHGFTHVATELRHPPSRCDSSLP